MTDRAARERYSETELAEVQGAKRGDAAWIAARRRDEIAELGRRASDPRLAPAERRAAAAQLRKIQS